MPQLDPFIFFDEAYGTGLTLGLFWAVALVYTVPGLIRHRSWFRFVVVWGVVRSLRRFCLCV